MNQVTSPKLLSSSALLHIYLATENAPYHVGIDDAFMELHNSIIVRMEKTLNVHLSKFSKRKINSRLYLKRKELLIIF